jgi:hypothetical protein
LEERKREREKGGKEYDLIGRRSGEIEGSRWWNTAQWAGELRTA